MTFNHIAEEVCHALTIILRKSLNQGDISEDWRIANVSPIFKKGSRGKASNYRPVSLDSQVSKIRIDIERCHYGASCEEPVNLGITAWLFEGTVVLE